MFESSVMLETPVEKQSCSIHLSSVVYSAIETNVEKLFRIVACIPSGVQAINATFHISRLFFLGISSPVIFVSLSKRLERRDGEKMPDLSYYQDHRIFGILGMVVEQQFLVLKQFLLIMKL